MSPRDLSPAGERLLDAAMELFAANGYDGTSVGEIQEAAGLTFGSGALYKHFRSKEDVLAEGMERFVEHTRGQQQLFEALDGLAIPEALTAIATQVMASLAADRDALRIAWRDLEDFPELMEKVRTERIRATFDQFTAWLTVQDAEGRVSTHDPAVVAAVALSSLAFFQLHSFLLHDTPGGIVADRFVTAWSELFSYALT
jgi:AcrR family transcriptional regulator